MPARQLGDFVYIHVFFVEPVAGPRVCGKLGPEFVNSAAFAEATKANPRLGAVTPVVLYRTLGPTLPDGAASAAALWTAAHRCAALSPASVRRAGFGEGFEAGERLFDAILASPSGVVFAADDYDETWRRIQTEDGRVNLSIPELLDELAALRRESPPGSDPAWPFLLSAGERRSFTANTIMRDPEWRKTDPDGALRVSPADAARIGLADGGHARLTTKRASVVVTVVLVLFSVLTLGLLHFTLRRQLRMNA